MANIRIRLGDADRERLGAPEWVENGTARGRHGDVRALKQQAGMTPKQLGERIDDADYEALGALVWLALGKAGVSVPLAELDFDFGGLDFKTDAEGEARAPTGAKRATPRRTRR